MRWLIPLAVTLVAAAYFAVFVGYGVNLEDEGLILFQIARTFRGQLPYIDFHTGYTPGTFYVNAALFHLFGESVLPLRWFLVGVNALQVLLIFVLARPFAGAALSAAAALGYAAFLPCFTGEFASFNVPYPAWYANVFFLLTQVAFDRHLNRGGRAWLLAAGLAAGAAFSFKPNVGVLALLACGLGLAVLRAGRDDRDRVFSRGLLAAAVGFLLLAFGFDVVSAQFPLIAGPTLVLIAGRMWWATATSREDVRLGAGIGAVAAGGVFVTLPWVAVFLPKLGVGGFLREVLLVGSDADRIYATLYPVPRGFPDAWPTLLAFIILATGLGGVYAERGRVAVSRVVLALLGAIGSSGLLLISWGRMPEGISRSILWQAQYVGFYLVPMMCVVVSGWVLRRLASGHSTLTPYGRRILGALVFTVCMYVGLYPRVDTMHLIVAMPSALVLAAACAARMARAWAGVFRFAPAAGRGLLVATAAVLSAVVVQPNFEGVFSGSLRPPPQIQYDSPRMPVSVEASRGWDAQALNAVIGYLRVRLRPGEPIFGFPALPLIPFALGHPTPAPHDYFFPGRPDHRAEVEIVRRLEAAPPRYMVTMNRRLGFFSEAPAYYFILRSFLRQEYQLAARFGRYDVFRRRSEPQEPMIEQRFTPTVDDADLVASLADPNREIRRVAALRILDLAGTPEQVDAVVARLAPDEASQLLVLRNFAELGDGRALDYVYRAFERGTGRVKGEAVGALSSLPLFDWARRYLIAAERPEVGPGVDVDLGPVDLDQARAWVGDYKARRQLGLFAAWALARTHSVSAVPVLQQMLEQETVYRFLQVVSGYALVELGHPEAVCELVKLLGYQRHDVQDTMPSFLIGWAQRFPAPVATCLEQGLRDSHPMAREQTAWVAGAAQLPALAPALRHALDDDKPAVRLAATWALGRLADVAAVPALRRLATDPDPAQQAFAAEALRRIGN